jgi:protein gp37
MGRTAISWTDLTFNLWWGCVRVSPGCVGCYADMTARRYGHAGLWRRSGPRRFLGEGTWSQPRKWNRDAELAGRVDLVFCSSMADAFEIHPVAEIAEQQELARQRLWQMVDAYPFLIWQLLTKRLDNVADLVPWGDTWPRNVWLGTSVEDQERAYSRLSLLTTYPADIAVRFVSVEPLLEPVQIEPWLAIPRHVGVDWVIVGGESGGKARRFELSWARDIRDQVARSSAAFFFKQTGTQAARELAIKGKGETFEDLPADLRIRQFPRAYADYQDDPRLAMAA